MTRKTAKKNRIDLTTGPVFSNLLRFAVPILMGTIITQLYNVADSVIVGHFVSADALAAVSASAPVTSIISLFLIGLSAGSNVIIAQCTGSGDGQALQRAMSTISVLTLICSAFITVAGLLASWPLLKILNTPDEIFGSALSYLIVIYIGTTGNLVYHMGSGIMQGMGDSTWPFFFLLGCSVLNVVLDLVAVLFLNGGVLGVAIATATSQFVSGAGMIWRLNHGGYGVKISLKQLHFYPDAARRILSIGIPGAIQNIGNSVAALCVQSSVNIFGSDFIAANSVVTKVDDLVTIPVLALSTALCTFVGQNMGSFDMARIRKGINSSILSLEVLGVFLCGILICFRKIFPLMFSTDPEVISYASTGLFIMSFMCLFYGIDRCLVNAMRGAGKAVVPMITAQFGAFSRIPLAYFLGAARNDWHGIFYALLIAAFLRMAAIAVYYYCGGWKRAVRKFEEKHRAGK